MGSSNVRQVSSSSFLDSVRYQIVVSSILQSLMGGWLIATRVQDTMRAKALRGARRKRARLNAEREEISCIQS